jgi:thiol:disulfide interchange protein DsbD
VFAWIDSFILPDPAIDAAGELPWTGDLAKALDTARTRGGYVFIDFTGETCTNCKLNERSVFIRPEVKELFKKYQLVQLYTDKVPERHYPAAVRSRFVGTARQTTDAEINRDFQNRVFGSIQLPLYVILKPESGDRVRIVDVYDEGKISNVAAFVEFLKKPVGG